MNNNKNYFIGGIVVVALLFGVFYFGGSPKQGQPGVNGRDGRNGENAGALSGPDISSPYITYGGVQLYSQGQKMSVGTTSLSTTCSLQSPPATSTLAWAQVDFTNSSTTPIKANLSKDTQAFGNPTGAVGSTTYFANIAIPANSQGSMSATSTFASSTLINGQTFAPNTFLNVFVQDDRSSFTGINSATNFFSPSGSCAAEWKLPKAM